MNWKIWALVPVLYGIFSLWYFNWSGPITPREIDKFMAAFNEAEGSQHTDAAVFRKFMEQDDGSEFVMLNLVQLHEKDVPHPITGEKMPALNLLDEYFGPFSQALLKRGGHPVFQARRVGGNVDSWNADNNADNNAGFNAGFNVDFSAAAMMRYKSRRELVALVIDPAFSDAHSYKLAAIERTISYPTQVIMSTSLGPPVSVLLLLMAFASLIQNIVFVIRR